MTRTDPLREVSAFKREVQNAQNPLGLTCFIHIIVCYRLFARQFESVQERWEAELSSELRDGKHGMDEIFDFFEAAMDDNRLTRSEAKALRECLRAEDPGFKKLNVLRAKLFDLVGEKLTATNSRELIRFLEEAVKLMMQQLKPGADEVVSKCYFSPGNGCRNAVKERLRNASKSARICVFTISDDSISREIVDAHKRGVRVEVMTDNDKMDDAGSDIRRLKKAGVTIFVDRTRSHMHHKFAVVDSRWLLSGSFNWTRSASAYNQENIMITNDRHAVAEYEKEFERLIPEMERLR